MSSLYLSGFQVEKNGSKIKTSKIIPKELKSSLENLEDGIYFCFQLSTTLSYVVPRTGQVYLGALVNCEKARNGVPKSKKEEKLLKKLREKHSTLSKSFVAFKVPKKVKSIIYLGAIFNISEAYYVSSRTVKKVVVKSMKDKRKQEHEILLRHAIKDTKKENSNRLVIEFMKFAKIHGFEYRTDNFGRDQRILKSALEVWADNSKAKYEELLHAFFKFKDGKPKNPKTFITFVKNMALLNNPSKIVSFLNELGIKHQSWFLEVDLLYEKLPPEEVLKILKTLKKNLEKDSNFIKKLKFYIENPHLVREHLCKYGLKPVRQITFNKPLEQQVPMIYCGCGFCEIEVKKALEAGEFYTQQQQKNFEFMFERTLKALEKWKNAEVEYKRAYWLNFVAEVLELQRYFDLEDIIERIPEAGKITEEDIQELHKLIGGRFRSA